MPAIAAREVDGRPEDASGRETEPRLRSSRALTMSCSFAPAKADAAATRNTFARSDIGTAPIRADPRREETAVDTRCSTGHPADDRPRTPTRGDAPRTRECGRKGASALFQIDPQCELQLQKTLSRIGNRRAYLRASLMLRSLAA